ncbi:hypothetical protein KXQ82_16510 [Mucilaginibacter sp. HMF5004]|uniref:STM3941 family protein n=1 Tax=Mucilaginibacter rivuli TaxID=2857527 RepID=UPI001C5FDFA7|nr:STM3941 family protein [Mucilaginibacter rivuli]MBW4891332.1 hypothetical protein [Mucilaginibacter rivuli]
MPDMIENTRIEIPLSKTKLAKLLLFSIIFLIIGLWMVIKDPQISNPVFNNPVVKIFASYGAIIMGVLGSYYFSRKLFDNNPGLVINEEGIYDNTSIFKFGLIPWSDISQIYERTIQATATSRQHFVTIGLTKPGKYITKETNTLKRKLLEANAKSYGSPIHISTNGLKTNHQDLFILMSERFENYKTGNSDKD